LNHRTYLTSSERTIPTLICREDFIDCGDRTAGLIRGLFSQADSTYGPSMLIDMEDG